MGAVNTVVNRCGRLIGHNTDGSAGPGASSRALPQADLTRVVLLALAAPARRSRMRCCGWARSGCVIVDREADRADGRGAAGLNAQYGGRTRARRCRRRR